MFRQLRTACAMLLAFNLLFGVAYPFAVTGLAQAAFPGKANGSLIERNGRVVGSALIGQPFDDPKFFWSRPSATGPFPYNAGASCGSNFSLTNPVQADAIRNRVRRLRVSGIAEGVAIPIDLVTASGSGLDPHISVAAAQIQIPRVAGARGITEESVRKLVERQTEGRQLGILGEPRVHVLSLNLAVDEVARGTESYVQRSRSSHQKTRSASQGDAVR